MFTPILRKRVNIVNFKIFGEKRWTKSSLRFLAFLISFAPKMTLSNSVITQAEEMLRQELRAVRRLLESRTAAPLEPYGGSEGAAAWAGIAQAGIDQIS